MAQNKGNSVDEIDKNCDYGKPHFTQMILVTVTDVDDDNFSRGHFLNSTR